MKFLNSRTVTMNLADKKMDKNGQVQGWGASKLMDCKRI